MPDGEDESAFYMVVHGSFDREKIEAYMQVKGKARRGTFGKLTTYVPQDVDFDGPEPTVSWIDDRTLIPASTPDFPKLVHSVNGEGLSAKGSRLGRLLKQAQGQFFFAVEIPEQVPESSESSSGPRQGRCRACRRSC
jgi:hypothetical protein